ncbi:MAG TPA: hypothetical protein VKR32_13405 [Puia sp.]|nr:hypothetical protein [Puia sp.]
MEVHHPPHVEKKNFKEYLLEFFMLFLAVFLGFVAENIRENIAENNRAKEYAISLVQDLQHDTTAINSHRKSADMYVAIADSLLNLSKKQLDGRNAAEFSFYTRFTYWTVPIAWNRATFEQIKNSGNLRYFKNYKLLEKLMKYDGLINEIQAEFQDRRTRSNLLLNHINKIIEPEMHYALSTYNLSTLDTMSNEAKENFFNAEVGSMENLRSEIKEMLNMVIVQQRNVRFDENRLRRAMELANELISDLEMEYKMD